MNAPRESYAKVLGNLAGVLAGVVALAATLLTTGPTVPRAVRAPAPVKTSAVAARAPSPAPVEAPPPPRAEPAPVPVLDRAAVAAAEHDLDAASRDRARAEARAADAAKRLADASLQAAADARAAKSLASRVRDPSARLARASARGNFLKAERDRLKNEVATLATAPRPKAQILANKNPVARAAEGDEQHFELRRNRVAYVDLDRLIALVKSDAQLRIRLTDGAKVVSSRVGPVGAFSLHYSLMRGLGDLDGLLDSRIASYNLRGWEIVPEFEARGEPYEATTRPVSDYARVINRLNPARSTVTLWIYPDSFTLFRKLRDDLQSRGFLVAARPLPDGMAIRGSPSGSQSAGQ